MWKTTDVGQDHFAEVQLMQELVKKYDCDASGLTSYTPRPLVGVYFLFLGNDVIYVGQSTDISGRISNHSKKFEFDSFAFIECPKEHLNYVEAHFIAKQTPPRNKSIPVNPIYKRINKIKEMLNWEMRVPEFKKLMRALGIEPIDDEMGLYNALEILKRLDKESLGS